jgi:hypothetical protein
MRLNKRPSARLNSKSDPKSASGKLGAIRSLALTLEITLSRTSRFVNGRQPFAYRIMEELPVTTTFSEPPMDSHSVVHSPE